jgi:hypothetical protein
MNIEIGIKIENTTCLGQQVGQAQAHIIHKIAVKRAKGCKIG